MERSKNKRIFRAMMRFGKGPFFKSWQSAAVWREAKRRENKKRILSQMTGLKKIISPRPPESKWGKKGGPQTFPDKTRWFSI